jgi:hypothetical protein
MQAHDLDAPNLDTARKPHGRSRLFLEDDPPISVEDGPPTSIEYDESMPSVTKWTPSAASAVFVFLFLVLAGVGGALAWRYYGGQATDVIGTPGALPGATNKPTVPPEGFAELQQQLKSIAVDLAAVRNTLEQQSAANHDQLTRIQEQIAQPSIALQATKQELSQKLSSPPTDTPVQKPLPKPAQHPAHVSTQVSSKPIQVAPPQPLLPPKQ